MWGWSWQANTAWIRRPSPRFVLTLLVVDMDAERHDLQAKVNDRGIAALAYNVKLRPGVTVGLGVSLDTQNLNEAAHKVCWRLTSWGAV